MLLGRDCDELSICTISGIAESRGLQLARHTPFFPADPCGLWNRLLLSQTAWEGHALSACVFISPGRLGGSETDQMLGHYGLRSDSAATCMDSTWEIVTCADFLSPLPSQPSQTLPFHKRPGDVFEAEDQRSRVTQTPRVCAGTTLGGLGGAEHGDGGHPQPFQAAFLSRTAASRSSR